MSNKNTNRYANTIPVIPSRFNSCNFEEVGIMNSVTYSNSIFKIIGLRCSIDELPESLYFMMNSDTYFRLPMPTEVQIEKYNLIENIALIEKILSFFEIEEIKIGTIRYKEAEKEIEKINKTLYKNESLQENSFVLNEIKKEVLKVQSNKNIALELKESAYTYIGRKVKEASISINKLPPSGTAELYSNDFMNFVYNASKMSIKDLQKHLEAKSPASKKTKEKKEFDLKNTKTRTELSKLIDKLIKNTANTLNNMFDINTVTAAYIKDFEYKVNASGLFKSIICMINTDIIDDDDIEYYTNGGYLYLDKEFAESDEAKEVIGSVSKNYITFLSEHIFTKELEAKSYLHKVLTSEPENKYIIRELLTPLFPFVMENEEYYPASVNGTNVDLYGFWDEEYQKDSSGSSSKYYDKVQRLLKRKNEKLYNELREFIIEVNKLICSGTNFVNFDFESDNRILEQIKNDMENFSSRILNSFTDFINSEELYRFLSCPMFYHENRTKESILKEFDSHIGIVWSSKQTIVTQFSTIDIKDSIKTRYYFTDQNFIDRQNMVIDSCVPKLLYSANMDFEDAKSLVKGSSNISSLYKRTMYAISPLTAELFNCNQIPIEHLCRVLGYSKQDIKTLMMAVKDSGVNLAFIGAGGTCANTAIWLHQMQKMCNVPYLFGKVYCYEEDSLEIHNLLRFPKDPYSHSYDKHLMAYESDTERMTNKMHYISKELEALSKTTPLLERRFIATGNEENSASSFYPVGLFKQEQESVPVLDNNGTVIDFKTESFYKIKGNTVIYGAPTIETRRNLSKCGGFVSATHSDSSCSIWINPEQEADIQVESYGMIQLTSFFMNQLRMAIGLLEILAANNRDELLFSSDNNFMNYSFTQENQLSNDRVYNFKIEENAAMVNDEQAALEF